MEKFYINLYRDKDGNPETDPKIFRSVEDSVKHRRKYFKLWLKELECRFVETLEIDLDKKTACFTGAEK